jgi:hypothetical protein
MSIAIGSIVRFGHARTPAEFALLWIDAQAAAQRAAEQENIRLGNENSRGFDCGFAWLEFDGKHAFARWLKKNDIGRKGYPKGIHVWYSKLHNVPTQSISVHEAACRAAREVLAHGLQTSGIHVSSRLD